MFDRRRYTDAARRLSELNEWRAAFSVALQWLLIVGAVFLAKLSGSWLVSFFGMIVVASRQHALAVLVHDAAHYRLFNNRRLNDFVGEFLLAFPVVMSTYLYRCTHMLHHRYANTAGDPDLPPVFSETGNELPPANLPTLRRFLLLIRGASTEQKLELLVRWSPLAQLFSRSSEPYYLPTVEKFKFMSFLALVGIAIWEFRLGTTLLLYWLVPLVFILPPMVRITGLAEHVGVRNESELSRTRTVLASPLEKFFIAPCNVHYHLEHHLFPSVPFYNLPELHRLLMSDPAYRDAAQITARYLGYRRGLLGELWAANRGSTIERRLSAAR